MKQSKGWIFRCLALAASAGLVAVAYCSVDAGAKGGPPWYCVVPPLLAVTLALVTNRMFPSLVAAVAAGGLLCAFHESSDAMSLPFRGLLGAGQLVVSSFKDKGGWAITDSLLILVHVVFIMAMIAVMITGGGLKGVAQWLARFARGPRSTKLVTVAAGLVIFIDDYANTMIIGSTLRPMTDDARISREKLAFLVDATAAPIAGIAIISTWIGYEVGLLSEIAADMGVARDGYAMFLDALGYRFYCIGMIGFVFLNSLSNCDYGPMATAERRAREQGKLLADGETPMTSQSLSTAQPHPQARVFAAVAIVPLMVLLTAFVGGIWIGGDGLRRLADDPTSILSMHQWRDVFCQVNSIPMLAMAAAAGFVASLLMALVVARIPWGSLARSVGMGVTASLLPVGVLLLAWSLKEACTQLETGQFLAAALGDQLEPAFFPGLVFLVAGLTSFATGTSWGTMAILIPTALPVAFQLDGGVYGPITVISVAAVLDGAIFGDHCSPISDTTIMSSTASACNHMAHVRTQMPYSLTVALFALSVGYLPAALGYSKWLGILGGLSLSALLFFTLWLVARTSRVRLDAP